MVVFLIGVKGVAQHAVDILTLSLADIFNKFCVMIRGKIFTPIVNQRKSPQVRNTCHFSHTHQSKEAKEALSRIFF